MAEARRYNSLIIGSDIDMFQAYWLHYLNVPERHIMGFVYSNSESIPNRQFKAKPRNPYNIYTLRSLEKRIVEKKIEKCLIHAQNIDCKLLNSIIHRILATNTCEIEFIPSIEYAADCCKPVVSVTSTAKDAGKSIVARHLCRLLTREGRKVSVVTPRIKIQESKDPYIFEKGINFEIMKEDDIPESLDSETKSTVKLYLESGAVGVFVTAVTSKALVSAEQCSDIILLVAEGCSTPPVSYKYKFCVFRENSIPHWPGLVNAQAANTLICVPSTDIPKTKILPTVSSQDVAYAWFKFELTNDTYVTLVNRPVITVSESQDNLAINGAALRMGAISVEATRGIEAPEINKDEEEEEEDSDDIDEAVRCTVPTMEITKKPPESDTSKTDQIQITTEPAPKQRVRLRVDNKYRGHRDMERKQMQQQLIDSIQNSINHSEAEVVIITVPVELPNVDRSKQIVYATNEVDDRSGVLTEWVNDFCAEFEAPPLQKHFEGQAKIIEAYCHASEKELKVGHNDARNRETFCRLFLKAHLPPGFRVTGGEIIDSHGNTTGELDVVIVSDLCPTLSSMSSVIAPILADTVLGVVEVKTTLKQDSLRKALGQMRAVRALMPMHDTLVAADGSIVDDPLSGKIITGVFGFNDTPEIEDMAAEIIGEYPNVADFVVCASKFGYFRVETLQVCGINFGAQESVNGYVRLSMPGMALGMLYGLFNSIAATRRFSGLNCMQYLTGSWGTRRDAVARKVADVQNALSKIEPLISKYGMPTVADKEAYYRARTELLNKLNIIGG